MARRSFQSRVEAAERGRHGMAGRVNELAKKLAALALEIRHPATACRNETRTYSAGKYVSDASLLLADVAVDIMTGRVALTVGTREIPADEPTLFGPDDDDPACDPGPQPEYPAADNELETAARKLGLETAYQELRSINVVNIEPMLEAESDADAGAFEDRREIPAEAVRRAARDPLTGPEAADAQSPENASEARAEAQPETECEESAEREEPAGDIDAAIAAAVERARAEGMPEAIGLNVEATEGEKTRAREQFATAGKKTRKPRAKWASIRALCSKEAPAAAGPAPTGQADDPAAGYPDAPVNSLGMGDDVNRSLTARRITTVKELAAALARAANLDEFAMRAGLTMIEAQKTSEELARIVTKPPAGDKPGPGGDADRGKAVPA